MEVAKRSEKVIKRYGHADTRESFDIPLVTGEFKEKFWEQLIPFGWLVKEYIDTCAPEHGSLFMIQRSRAQQIIKAMTNMYPHWLRAQSEHFYGHYIFKNPIKLAEFLKVQDPKNVMNYTKFSADSQHKESEITFDWIQPEVEKIQKRIAEEKRRFAVEYDF
jgi:hypothetical protein